MKSQKSSSKKRKGPKAFSLSFISVLFLNTCNKFFGKCGFESASAVISKLDVRLAVVVNYVFVGKNIRGYGVVAERDIIIRYVTNR